MVHQHHPAKKATGETPAHDDTSAAEVVLELIGDEDVRTILDRTSDAPKPAHELAEACEGSKPTVYRRLNRLEEAGIVEARVELRPDGHHRRSFTSDFDRVTIEFAESRDDSAG